MVVVVVVAMVVVVVIVVGGVDGSIGFVVGRDDGDDVVGDLFVW